MCRQATFPPFFNASCIIHSAESGLVTAATFMPLRVRAEGSWERMLIALMVQGHKQLLVSDVGIEVVRLEQTEPPLSRVKMLFDFRADKAQIQEFHRLSNKLCNLMKHLNGEFPTNLFLHTGRINGRFCGIMRVLNCQCGSIPGYSASLTFPRPSADSLLRQRCALLLAVVFGPAGRQASLSLPSGVLRSADLFAMVSCQPPRGRITSP